MNLKCLWHTIVASAELNAPTLKTVYFCCRIFLLFVDCIPFLSFGLSAGIVFSYFRKISKQYKDQVCPSKGITFAHWVFSNGMTSVLASLDQFIGDGLFLISSLVSAATLSLSSGPIVGGDGRLIYWCVLYHLPHLFLLLLIVHLLTTCCELPKFSVGSKACQANIHVRRQLFVRVFLSISLCFISIKIMRVLVFSSCFPSSVIFMPFRKEAHFKRKERFQSLRPGKLCCHNSSSSILFVIAVVVVAHCETFVRLTC